MIFIPLVACGELLASFVLFLYVLWALVILPADHLWAYCRKVWHMAARCRSLVRQRISLAEACLLIVKGSVSQLVYDSADDLLVKLIG